MEPWALKTFQEINMKRILFPLAVVLAGLSFGATAQNMKPGLWEVSSKMKTASGEMERGMAEMQAQMAAMTPEQRKMMESMYAPGVIIPDLSKASSGEGFIGRMVDRYQAQISDVLDRVDHARTEARSARTRLAKKLGRRG